MIVNDMSKVMDTKHKKTIKTLKQNLVGHHIRAAWYRYKKYV